MSWHVSTGLLQASCPSFYAAFLQVSGLLAAGVRSGLSHTTVGAFQFRVEPLQRDGFLRFAAS